jgi:hypothetical protein
LLLESGRVKRRVLGGEGRRLMKEIEGKKRFRQIAMEKGFIKKEQLVEAIFIQLSNEARGLGRQSIGSILFESRQITISQIREGLRALDGPVSDDRD